MKNLSCILVLLFVTLILKAQQRDLAFQPEILRSAPGFRTFVLPDNKILVSSFNMTKVGDTNVNRSLVRLQPNGSLDSTFLAPNFTEAPRDIVVQEDGKIVICGNLEDVTRGIFGNIIRLNANGSLDTTFNIFRSEGALINNLHLLDNQKIFASGQVPSETPNSSSAFLLLSNGQIDTGFPVTTISDEANFIFSFIYDIDALSNNELIIAGVGLPFMGAGRSIIIVDSTGTVDTSFNPISLPTFITHLSTSKNRTIGVLTGSDKVTLFDSKGNTLSQRSLNVLNNITFDLIPATDSSFYVAGNNMFEIASDGAVKGLFFNLANSFVLDMKQRQDGKVLVVGDFTKIQDQAQWGMTLIDPQTITIDPNFKGSLFQVGSVRDLLLQEDDKLIVVGNFNFVNGQNINHAVRLLRNGQIDTTFYNAIASERQIAQVEQQSNGNLIFTGQYQRQSIDNKFNGALITDRDGNFFKRIQLAGTEGCISCPFSFLAIDSLDRIYIAEGTSNSLRGQELNRYDPLGNFEQKYNETYIKPGTLLYGMDIVEGDKLLLYGRIAYADAPETFMVRANADGTLDRAFYLLDTLSEIEARSFIVYPNGDILVGGNIENPATQVNEAFLRKFKQDGTIDPSFTSPEFSVEDDNTSSLIFDLIPLVNKRIFTIGRFSSVNGLNVDRPLVVIDENGTLISEIPIDGEISSINSSTTNSGDLIYLSARFTSNGLSFPLIRFNDVVTSSENKIEQVVEQAQARIFPNPVIGDQINIELPDHWEKRELKIQLVALSNGKIISTQKSSYQKLISMNFSSLQAGAYAIRVLDNKGNYLTQIFLKQ